MLVTVRERDERVHTHKEKEREVTMHMDAHIMLKPLQLKGALIDRNHADKTQSKQ